MDKDKIQFKFDSPGDFLGGQDPYVLEEWTTRIAINDSDILEQRLRLAIKPRPKPIPEKLWLKLASIFLKIEQR